MKASKNPKVHGACSQYGSVSTTVLLDTAPLFRESAFQGIGRYLIGLASGFHELEQNGELPYTVAGLVTGKHPWQKLPLETIVKFTPGASVLTEHFSCSWRRRLASGKVLRQLGCSLLHLPEATCVPLFSAIPFVKTIHDIVRIQFPHLYSKKAPRLRLALNLVFMKWYLAVASHIVTDSRYVKDQLQKRFGINHSRVSVAYPGVDHQKYNLNAVPDESEKLFVSYGVKPPYFLFVGTADPRKNLPFLLQAMAASPLEIPLVVAGRIHDLHRPPLEAKLQQLHLGEKVRFLGYVPEEDLPALYRHSLALLFPSLGEGFGLPVVEAMACGTPVVAFANSSIPEVAGDAAWLVPTNDMAAFVEAMRALVEHPSKRQELIAKGLERAKLFTWENTARAVLSVYRQVLGVSE